MLKIASILIGEDPVYTAAFQPSSRRKVILLASCLLLPVLLWFINGYLLVRQVIQGTPFAACLTATIAALLIYLIERAIILAKPSPSITVFRFLLGFVIAFLGSISLDEVVFKQDIDNQVATYQANYVAGAEAQADATYRNQIVHQQRVAESKYQAWKQALASASGEADGTAGSGITKVGRITQLKVQVAAIYARDYNGEKEKLEKLKQGCESRKDSARTQARRAFNGNGLLLRIKAMHELIRHDGTMLVVYLAFTAFLFLLEFIVVIIKVGSEKSIDEKLEEAKEQLLLYRAQKTLENAAFYFEPAAQDPRVRSARAALENVRSVT